MLFLGFAGKVYKDRLYILLIFLTGLFFRIYNLAGESIWLDEGFSVFRAHLGLSSLIRNLSGDVHPPFYFLILRYWTELFGDSEFSIRFLSVFFSFCTMVMTFQAGRLLFDKKTAILSSLLVSLSVFHIYYAHEARPYSLMVLLTLLSMYFFIRLSLDNTAKSSIGYVLSSTFMLYTHNYGIFIILAQNIYYYTQGIFSKPIEPGRPKWLLLQGLLFFLYLPWMGILITQTLNIQGKYWLALPNIEILFKTLTLYSDHSPILLLLLVFLIYFSFLTFKKDNALNSSVLLLDKVNINKLYLLSLWFIVPILVPFVVSQFSTPIYHSRYTIAASVPFFILAAKGLQNINNKYLKSIIILVIISFSLNGIREYNAQNNKQQWRAAVKYLESNAMPTDLILCSPGDSLMILDYYSERADLNKRSFPPNTDWENINESTINKLDKAVKGRGRVWYILSFNPNTKRLIQDKFKALHYRPLYIGNYEGSGWQGLSQKNLDLYLFEKERS